MKNCNKENSINLLPDGSYFKCFNNLLYNCSIKNNSCEQISSETINIINFIVTNKCNFNCLYCADSIYKNCINNNLNINYNNLKNIMEYFKNVYQISYSFYEPFLSKNLLNSIIFFSTYKNINSIQISTDGLYLNNNFLEVLSKFENIDFNIIVNLNFPKKIHDFYKNNSYDKIINNIKKLKKFNNIKICCEIILFKHTFNKCKDFEKDYLLNKNLFDEIYFYYNHYDIKYFLSLEYKNKIKLISNHELKNKIKNIKIKYDYDFLINNLYYKNTMINYNSGEKYDM